MRFVYLVTTFDTITGESHEVLAAFSTFDKAEDYLLQKQKVQTNYSYEYLIETIAVDVE